MPYRIAGVDVHKKMLAVALRMWRSRGNGVFERRQFGTSPSKVRGMAEWFVEREVEEVVMESTAQYWRPVWEALERHWQPTRRARADGRADVRRAASRAGAVEPGTTRPEARFSRCRTVGETIGRGRAHPELCAGCDAAPLADGHAAQIPIDVQPGAAPEPSGVPARGSPHQGVESGLGFAWAQCPTHAARGRERRNRPRGPSPPWGVRGCTPRRISCATRSAPAPI